MSSNLIVNPTIPVGSIPHNVSSASKHIIKSQLRRYYTESQVDFSPNGNNEIVFHINSPTDLWDAQSSYIRFKLTTALNNGGVDDLTRYLAEGGAHSLFERIEVFTRSGVLIERIDDYAKLYSIMSSGSMSRDFVEQSLHDEADSGNPYEKLVTFDPAAATFDGTVTFAALSGLAQSELGVGDRISVYRADTKDRFEAVVATIVDNNSFTIQPLDVAQGPIAAGSILDISAVTKSAREVAATTEKYDVCFTPFSPFLMNGSYVPLQLIRGGLRIVLTLVNNAAYSLVSKNEVSTSFTGADFIIKTPEYMCMMHQPDESLNAQMLDMYKSGGLHYVFPIYRHYLDVVGLAKEPANLNHHVNLRSVRSIYQKIQDDRANTVSASTAVRNVSTYTADSVAQGLKAGLSTYQYSVGSLRFPESSPTKLTSVSNAEALKEFKRTMQQMGAVNVFDKRFLPCEWRQDMCQKYKNESGGRDEAQRLILSATMSRDPSPWSGVDASLANLQSELTFGDVYTVGTNRYVHTFVEADAVLSISSDSIVRRS